MNDILSEEQTRAIQDILTRELDVKPEQLAYDAQLEHDLGADSLTLVEITMAIEDKFAISIPDERWESVRTVGALIETLAELLQEQRGPLREGNQG
jgi:acyl carrier protein